MLRSKQTNKTKSNASKYNAQWRHHIDIDSSNQVPPSDTYIYTHIHSVTLFIPHQTRGRGRGASESSFTAAGWYPIISPLSKSSKKTHTHNYASFLHQRPSDRYRIASSLTSPMLSLKEKSQAQKKKIFLIDTTPQCNGVLPYTAARSSTTVHAVW